MSHQKIDMSYRPKYIAFPHGGNEAIKEQAFGRFTKSPPPTGGK